MNKEDLADIHIDWIEELDKLRKPALTLLSNLPQEEQDNIKKYVDIARSENGNGVVPFKTLAEQIEKRFGYKFSGRTISDWVSKSL